jgi:hypothetical protein
MRANQLYRSTKVWIAIFLVCSLIHFVHNAVFLTDYPGLPQTWKPSGVMAVWLVMGALLVSGGIALKRGRPVIGTILLAIAVIMGFDSLAHYVVAKLTAHTFVMNLTIFLDVGAAILLGIALVRGWMKPVANSTHAA